jgi:hypothetical protein
MEHGDIDMRHGAMNMETWIWRHGHGNKIKRKEEAQAIFLNPFTVCSSCKKKVVICPFVEKETNGSCPFANGLILLNELAHL